MRYLILLAACFLSGCAGAQYRLPTVEDAKVDERRQMMLTERNADLWVVQTRLDSISWLIRSNNLHLCQGKAHWENGMRAIDWEDYSKLGIQQSQVLFLPPREGGFRVQSVTPGGPAADAGIEPGQLLSKNELGAIENELVCVGEVLLARLGGNPSFPCTDCTDGDRVFLSKELVDWLETDDLFAAVIAHETAHIGSQHIEKMRDNSLIGSIFGAGLDVANCKLGFCTSSGAIAGAQAGAIYFGHEFEHEADLVGMYMASNAGFDTGVWEDMWMDLGVRFGLGGTSHPESSERAATAALLHDRIHKLRAQQGDDVLLAPVRK